MAEGGISRRTVKRCWSGDVLSFQPGNGKTTLAEAFASELMYPLIVVRYENVIGSYLGETASRLQKVFETAGTRKCVVFLDEFETLGGRDIYEIQR